MTTSKMLIADSIAWLKDYYAEKGYPVQELNLIGIQDSEDLSKDAINDYLGFWTKDDLLITKGTTQPSVFYTVDKKERNDKGTFHLMPGWHERIWCIGTHKGYEALVNDWRYCSPTKGWRDANYNFVRDAKDVIVCDYFGINFHRMHPISLVDKIGKYSAGCQTVRNPKDYIKILEAVKATKMCKVNKNCPFDYMLFEIPEVPKALYTAA